MFKAFSGNAVTINLSTATSIKLRMETTYDTDRE